LPVASSKVTTSARELFRDPISMTALAANRMFFIELSVSGET
jgi:hypothetical protein